MTTNYDTDAVFTTGIVKISDTLTPSPTTNKLYATGGNLYWASLEIGTLTPTFTTGLFGNGSATTPSITFTDDTDTGIYRVGGDSIGITTGTTLRMFVDNDLKLQNGTELQFQNFSSSYGQMNIFASTSDTTDFRFQSIGSGGQLTMDSYHFVLQNRGNRDDRAFVMTDLNETNTYYQADTLNGIINTQLNIRGSTGSNSTPSYSFWSDTDTGIYNPSSDTLAFSVGGSEKLSMTTSSSDFGTVEVDSDYRLSVISENNANIVIESDLRNDNDSHHPSIWLKQDGGAIIGRIGMGRVGLGTSADNEMYIDHYQNGGAHANMNFRTSGSISATGGYGGVPTITAPTTRFIIGQTECTFTNSLILDGTIQSVADPSITIKSSSTSATDAGHLQFLESGGATGWKIQHNASAGTVQDPLEINRIASGENPAIVINGTLDNSPGVRIYHTASAGVGGSGALKVDGGIHTGSLVVEDGDTTLHMDGDALIVEDTSGNDQFVINTTTKQMTIPEKIQFIGQGKTSTHSEIVTLEGTTNTPRFIRFRRGGVATVGDSGLIFGNFDSNNYYMFNNGSGLQIAYSTTNLTSSSEAPPAPDVMTMTNSAITMYPNTTFNNQIFLPRTSSDATPSITFTDDTDTGIYMLDSETGILRLVANGGTRLQIGDALITSYEPILVNDSTSSTSTTTGALVVNGGVGIGGALNVGSSSSFSGLNTFAYNSEAEQIRLLGVSNNTEFRIDASSNFYIENNNSGSDIRLAPSGGGEVDVRPRDATDTTIGFNVDKGDGVSGYTNLFRVSDSNTQILHNVSSTSPTSGSLVVSGGVGISGDVFIGSNLIVEESTNATDAVIKLVGEDSGTYTRTGYVIMKSATTGNKSMEFWNDSTDTSGTNTIFSFRNSAETEVSSIAYDGSLTLAGDIQLSSGNHISFTNSTWEIGYNITSNTTEQLTSNTIQIQVANTSTQGFQITDGVTAMFEVAGNTSGTTTFRNQTITFDGTSNLTFTLNDTYPSIGNTSSSAHTLQLYSVGAIDVVLDSNDNDVDSDFTIRQGGLGGTGTPIFRVNSDSTPLNENPGVEILHTSTSTSATTGALVVTGGVGIGGNLWVGSEFQVTNAGNEQRIITKNGVQHSGIQEQTTSLTTYTVKQSFFCHEINFDTSNGTANLPEITASSQGTEFIIVNMSDGGRTVTVTAFSGDYINDNSTTSIVLANKYDRVHLYAGAFENNGSSSSIWWIL